jgi:hypothetical protein
LLRRLSEDRTNQKLRETANDVADLVQQKIIDAAPPSFASGIEAQVIEDGEGRFRIVATAEVIRNSGWDESGEPVDIAPFVDQGTGIFGPNKQMIKPQQAKSMLFYWDKPGQARDYGGFSQGWWHAKKLHGQKGQNFMKKGWRNGMDVARRRFRKFLSEL